MSFHSASVTNSFGTMTRRVAALPAVAGRALEATATGEAGTVGSLPSTSGMPKNFTTLTFS
eukprot:6441333-Alexandrium_andersonii.AAC.1